MTICLIAIDLDTAGHVHNAMLSYQRVLRSKGWTEPQELEAFIGLLESVRNGHAESLAFNVHSELQDGNMDERDYLTPAEVAHKTRVSLSTVRRWIRCEQLRSSKHGNTRRIRRSDLDDFMSAQEGR